MGTNEPTGRVIDHYVTQLEIYAEVCPRCGSEDVAAEPRDGYEEYYCCACKKTYRVYVEEINTAIQWETEDGATHQMVVGRDADDRLREAGPDLLKACRELLEMFGEAAPYSLDPRAIRARAAIAKATGQA